MNLWKIKGFGEKQKVELTVFTFADDSVIMPDVNEVIRKATRDHEKWALVMEARNLGSFPDAWRRGDCSWFDKIADEFEHLEFGPGTTSPPL